MLLIKKRVYLNGLLQTFLTLAKTLSEGVLLQQSFRLLAESVIKGGSKNPVTSDMELFTTIVQGCKMFFSIEMKINTINIKTTVTWHHDYYGCQRYKKSNILT